MENPVDVMIRQLYCATPRIPALQFRDWALEHMRAVIRFDAAFWGTGQLETQRFHAVSEWGLDNQYAQRLIDTLPLNPIRDGILGQLGEPVSMSDVYPDEAFYASPLYAQLFAPYGIHRILATGHYDARSGLYTLISFYRKDRHHAFDSHDRQALARLTYHLVGAASHAYFTELTLRLPADHSQAAALCDATGHFHEVQPRFLDLLDAHYPGRTSSQLPFALPVAAGAPCHFDAKPGELKVEVEPLGELFIVYLRPFQALDKLTAREREIVDWITRGLSFKEVAKQLEVAPSTVSNHLYKIYHKLGITSRTELAKVISAAE